MHNELMLLASEFMMTMVSSCHGSVRARSLWPPQRSTTFLPSL